MNIDINYVHCLGPASGGLNGITLFDQEGYPAASLPDDFFSGDLTSSMENFKKDKRYEHYSCPAVQLWHKTNWAALMPFDLEFKWNKETRKLDINDKYALKMLEKTFFHYKDSRLAHDNTTEIQTSFFYLFWTNKKNTIILNTNHHPSLAANNIELIPARFPISHWIRPIHFAFKIIDLDKKILLKKGTPLFYFSFSCQENWDASFTLIRQEKIDLSMKREIQKNLLVPVYSRYSAWNLIKQRIFNKNKQCPFRQ
ncbi:hypothetical protein EBU71_15290 [bacterium]|nr:hypothetical protein [Candidatus Elulimicrobium humile]